MELLDIRWCMASVVRRAQRFKEITGKNILESTLSKLGFDKSKVRCFNCKQKGHFKRECTSSEVPDNGTNPFGRDYYKQAIYHRTSPNADDPFTSNNNQSNTNYGKQKEASTSGKTCFVETQSDEGFN